MHEQTGAVAVASYGQDLGHAYAGRLRQLPHRGLPADLLDGSASSSRRSAARLPAAGEGQPHPVEHIDVSPLSRDDLEEQSPPVHGVRHEGGRAPGVEVDGRQTAIA